LSKRLTWAAIGLAILAVTSIPYPIIAQSWTLRHSDTFTDTAFTSIDAHTPNTGTGYTNPAGGGIRPTIDDLGTGMRNGGDNGVYTTTSLLDDQKACMTIKSNSVQQDFRLFVRYDVNGGAGILSSANGYYARMNWNAGDADELILEEIVNGTRAALDTAITQVWADNQVLCVLAVGTTISVTVDGVQKFSVTDASFTGGDAAWYHGIGNGDNAVGDTFEVSDSSGGAPSLLRTLMMLGAGGAQ
jgi:hypothetical protein